MSGPKEKISQAQKLALAAGTNIRGTMVDGEVIYPEDAQRILALAAKSGIDMPVDPGICPEPGCGKKMSRGTKRCMKCHLAHRKSKATPAPTCAACGEPMSKGCASPGQVAARGGLAPVHPRCRSPEERLTFARKAFAWATSKTAEWMSENARKATISLSPLQRRENCQRARAALTTEACREGARKANAVRTRDERSETARKARAATTVEQEAERSRKIWATRRANAAKKSEAA